MRRAARIPGLAVACGLSEAGAQISTEPRGFGVSDSADSKASMNLSLLRLGQGMRKIRKMLGCACVGISSPCGASHARLYARPIDSRPTA